MTNNSTNDNVSLAFILTLAASLSTTIGATGVFFAHLQNRLVLAGSLGLSAGVMLYVSFIEIFEDSKMKFLASGVQEEGVMVLSTIFFFLGVFIVLVLDVLVHQLEHFGTLKNEPQPAFSQKASCEMEPASVQGINQKSATIVPIAVQPGVSDSTANTLTKTDNKKLIRASIITALAVGLHNFPEGLATFVSTLSDPKVGFTVSIAIGIHNIPEGLCVAMPLYYATGSRWRGFFWASMSGLTEFIGAVLGYVVIRGHLTEYVFGVVLGIVGGMMVCVSMRELLPVARRYDPEDRIVSWAVLCGMGIMGLSLVLS